MLVLYGTKFYGRTDEVPGRFYVATKFQHLYALPLVPLGSYLVLIGPEEDRLLPLGFSFKSLALAWIRAIAILAFIPCFMMALMQLRHISSDGIGREFWLYGPIAAALAAIFYYATSGARRWATKERAIAVAEMAGMGDDAVRQLEGDKPATASASTPHLGGM